MTQPFLSHLLLCMLSVTAIEFAPQAIADDAHVPSVDLSLLEEQAIKAAVKRVSKSVVRIETIGGLTKIDSVAIGDGATTGLIISPDGYVLSSAFHFAKKPTSILVTLPNGKRTAAKIVARDHSRRIVLLKVKAEEKLPVPHVAPDNEIHVGSWSIAIGKVFAVDQTNITVGIISAKNRIWDKAVQTDAKISPNNYGGPLVDIRGRVIGLLTPLSLESNRDVSGADWYDSGIGFAIPMQHLLKVLPKLKEGADLHPGLLGASFEVADMNADPAIIESCQPGSPALLQGMKPGDRITKINGHPISTLVQLKHHLLSRYAGDRIELIATRDNKQIKFDVVLTQTIDTPRKK